MSEVEVKVYKRMLFTVKNCSKKQWQKREYEKIVSPTFEICIGDNNTKWCIYLIPKVLDIEPDSYLGLYLYLKEAGSKDFTVTCKLGVLDNKRKIWCDGELVQTGNEFKEDLLYGISRKIHHDQLFDPSHRLVTAGILNLSVELTLTATKQKSPQKLMKGIQGGTFKPFSEYEKMFGDEFLADFKLKLKDGNILTAHKVVLAANSPVFFAMLQTDMQEAKQGIAVIPDFDSAVMNKVLQFIYCKKVSELPEHASSLIYAAEKYQLTKLKEICLRSIISTLRTTNAVESLIISYRISEAEKLFEKCLDLIFSNYFEVVNCVEWKKLPQMLLIKIMNEMFSRMNTVSLEILT